MQVARLNIHGITQHITFWKGLENEIPILALHGFTGSGLDFEPLHTRINQHRSLYAVDLLGHGNSDAPSVGGYYQIDSQVERIRAVVDYLKLQEYLLLGYSLGGRIALHYALNGDPRLKGLVLVGVNPGIVNTKERQIRYEHDKKIAEMIGVEGVKAFMDYWQAQPLMATQRDIQFSVYQSMLARRYACNQEGLINSLLMLSPGLLAPLQERLPNINIPCMLVAGQKDEKYKAINEDISQCIPGSAISIVSRAGHMAHLENIDGFLSVLNEWMLKEIPHVKAVFEK